MTYLCLKNGSFASFSYVVNCLNDKKCTQILQTREDRNAAVLTKMKSLFLLIVSELLSVWGTSLEHCSLLKGYN